MGTKKVRYFTADFETTVDKDAKAQTKTEVWAAACVELFTEDVNTFISIDGLFTYLKKLKSNVIVYFHNLKFDGSFWLPYLMQKLNFSLALRKEGNSEYWLQDKDMTSKTFKYTISSKGQWYSITIKAGKYTIEIRDSLKLLPFSVKKIGDNFKTKHKKLEIDYVAEGKRYSGCRVSKEEWDYIKNDVLVVKEALEIMLLEGHDKMTIGSCCLSEFKNIIGKTDYSLFFRDLIHFNIDPEVFGYKNADAYIRKSYKGGFCYVKSGEEGKIQTGGCTLDVNSLYPSVMHSISKNRYPVGLPHFFKGEIPPQALKKDRYYFVRFRTQFKLKKGKLPTVQIKDSLLYDTKKWLETSDIYDPEAKEYYRENVVTMTMTMTDYELFLEHYDVKEFEILDGTWFYTKVGLFDNYIDKYRKIKENSTGAIRELAKLFLNNLYGKLAANDDSSFKVAYIKENGCLGFRMVEAHEKTAGYIAVGTAVTSYARCFTIRAAQANYKYFRYADTDSIHCACKPEQIKKVEIHESRFLCWKVEGEWDSAIFSRQKTYIEHIVKKDGKECKPFYLIKGAGITDRPKQLLQMSLSKNIFKIDDKDEKGKQILKNEYELEFVNTKRTMKDYKPGLRIPSFLKAKRVEGGTVLYEDFYTYR